MLLPHVGSAGQTRLGNATALIVGCGALGTLSAQLLVRAGVGHLILVDRDLVEWTNLQRQVLFDESDAREARPKAEAARQRLAAINSQVRIDAVIKDLHAGNARPLVEACDVIVDGTDNFQTRYLLNDLAVQLARPYVYGGAVGTEGRMAVILPRSADGQTAWEKAVGAGPCLQCLFGESPAGGGATCDTAGVLGPVVSMIAAAQAGEALKILLGQWSAVDRSLTAVDLWQNHWYRSELGKPDPSCPCCGQREFSYASGKRGGAALTLCGREAVQIRPAREATTLNLNQLADQLAAHGHVSLTPQTLRLALPTHRPPLSLTIFTDGRAIVQGTDDPAIARSVYDRLIGS